MSSKRLTPDQLEQLLHGDRPVTVVDVRMPERFREGHVPGAVNLRVPELRKGVNLPKDHLIVTY